MLNDERKLPPDAIYMPYAALSQHIFQEQCKKEATPLRNQTSLWMTDMELYPQNMFTFQCARLIDRRDHSKPGDRLFCSTRQGIKTKERAWAEFLVDLAFLGYIPRVQAYICI